MSKYIQARVDEETWRWVRQLSLDSGLTQKALILAALQLYAKTLNKPKEMQHGQEER